MELQTVVQVSKAFGISARMLRYYEQIGLIESSRMDDYAYRVYDENTIKRLQQIIILRKLQIPIKQISDILKNQDAVTVIEVFKQNISELDEKITALSAVKSILARFIDELQEKADVHLKLDLLNDKTMISLVDTLSIPVSRVNEKVSMEELNNASETLNKIAEKNIRIVHLPPMTWALAGGTDCRAELKKFIDDIDLFRIKSDTRVFGFNAMGEENNVDTIFASIPDDLEIPAPLRKINFYGGLYMVCIGSIGNFNTMEWLEKNDYYEWAPEDNLNRPIMEELLNPYKRYNLDNYSEETGCTTDVYFPIREIKKYTDEEKEKINNLLAGLIPHDKSTNIELKSLIKHDEIEELNYTNGSMRIKSEKSNEPWENRIGMATPQKFNCPLKIELRVKSDNGNISVHYANGYIAINNSKMQCIFDVKDKTFYHYYCKDINNNEFANIEWILCKEFMAVKINGEIRYFNDDCPYIKSFSENPEYDLSAAVSVNAAKGVTITVESLRITELKNK